MDAYVHELICEMALLDYDQIQNFYNSHTDCWNADLFSRMTTKFIDDFVLCLLRSGSVDRMILNAGSGGKVYPVLGAQFHADIAANTLKNVENAYVCNIIDIPFDDDFFDCVVCVGTVINYCEAEKALAQFQRVTKKDATLILEYERSASGLIMDSSRNKDIVLFDHMYFDEHHRNLLYSDRYISDLLEENGFRVERFEKFNCTILWAERFTSEKIAHRLTVFENFFRKMPFINKYAHNAILLCRKI